MEIKDITSRLGITLNDMQRACADAVMNTGNNIVLLSPTGSGKTLAYLLPLTQMLDSSDDSIQAVVIVPGRELARQSAEVLRSLKSGLRGYACHGGRPAMDEHREMRSLKPQIVFTTPGRWNDHVEKGNVTAKSVRFIVIDEFDKCLAMGFRNEMTKALMSIPPSARRIFISATDFDEDVSGFQRLDFRPADEEENRVKVFVVRSKEKDKLGALSALLLSLGQESTMVFLNYRDSVERTAAFLRTEGFSVSEYHGGLDQKQREGALYVFANGSRNVLVCTDLGSRGLDMPVVENIIHYHLPESEDAYIHRVGRSTRWQNSGRTFFILNDEETLPDYIEGDIQKIEIQEAGNVPAPPKMNTLYIGKGKKNKISKGDIVGLLCKKGGLRSSDIGRIDVFDYYSLVAVNNQMTEKVLENVKNEKIKGQKTIIEKHN